MDKIVFDSPPKGFSASMEIAACYCRVGDKFLFLENSAGKEWGNTWSVPAGKIDPGEKPVEGAIREMFEETGILLKPSCITPFKSFYLKYPKYDFVYHTFRVVMSDFPQQIVLRTREHKQFAWLPKEEILKLPLMPGAEECLLSISSFS